MQFIPPTLRDEWDFLLNSFKNKAIMWVEKIPKEGDTVMVDLILPKETKVGVFRKFFDGRGLIDIGKRTLYVDLYTTFFVWV